VLGNTRHGRSVHRGTAAASGSYVEFGGPGKINLKSPLRYYGRLADEPEKLPWGAGYNIELSGVDHEGTFVPASGGLRLSYVARTDHGAPVYTRETPLRF
jgi:hypothetical protein